MQTEHSGISPPAPVVQTEVVTPAEVVAPVEVKTEITANKDGTTNVQLNGKTVVLPTNALARIKEEAREKGKKTALTDLAKQYGHGSVDSFLSALQKLKDPPAPAPAAQPKVQEVKVQKPSSNQGKQTMRTQDQVDKHREKLQKERDEQAKRAKVEASGRKRLQRALDSKEAEISLRDAAYRAGVKGTEISVALHLLSEELQGKSEDELKSFDENKFFLDQKAARPYLFGEVVRLATTGASAGGAPAPLKPGEASQVTAQGSQIDARTMSREDYQKLVRSRGFNVVAP